MSVSERFWSKVDKQGPDDCWEWTAAIDGGTGYGHFGIDYRIRQAHRIAWILTFGDIPDGMCVLHKCDNRACCNPVHLFLGTRKDNAVDMVMKGRQRAQKLVATQILEIRAHYKAGGISQLSLATEYGVSQAHISDIVCGMVWKHLQEEEV